jgi:hypothetical protein
MKAHLVLAAACIAALVGCAGTPSVAPTLPEARLDQIRTMIGEGSYLPALADIDALRRENADVPGADALGREASDALAKAFTTAVTNKDYVTGLRLLDSARALGRSEIAGTWTEKGLLQQVAASQAASGDRVLELLTRLRIVGLDSPD